MAGRPPGPPHSQLGAARGHPAGGKRQEPVRRGTFGQFCDVDSYTPYFIQRKSWANRPGSSETRLRGRALQQARAELFKRNPYCVSCQKKGISSLATERDHVIPLFRVAQTIRVTRPDCAIHATRKRLSRNQTAPGALRQSHR